MSEQGNDKNEKGTGRLGLANWSALRNFHVRVQQLISLPEFVAFAVGHATTKPTCDLSRRDAEMNTRGGAGVHDVKYICQKDTSDAYAWRGQVTTPAGTGVANRITYWTGAETLGSDADFTWNPSTNTLHADGAAVFNEAGGNKDFRVEGDADANLLFTDASTDRVGIGTATPANKLHVVTTGYPFVGDRHSADVLDPAVFLRKSRHATPGSHTIVQNGDGVGTIYFQGSNGTSFDSAAWIVATIDGTPGASNDMPGKITFATSPNGSATPVTAMVIDSTQKTTVSGNLAVVGNVGFYNTAPVAKPTVTGSRGGNAALADLLTELATLGLITDSTTA